MLKQEYWIDADGYLVYGQRKENDWESIAEIPQKHIEPLAKLIYTHPDLLDACKTALAKFRLMYEKIEAGYNAEDLYTDSKSWPLTTLRNAIKKAER